MWHGDWWRKLRQHGARGGSTRLMNFGGGGGRKAPDVRRVARLLAREGVPLEIALPLLARLRGVGLRRLASTGGRSRQLLYYAARGQRSAPAELRQAAQSLLGIDPWVVWEREAP